MDKPLRIALAVILMIIVAVIAITIISVMSGNSYAWWDKLLCFGCK